MKVAVVALAMASSLAAHAQSQDSRGAWKVMHEAVFDRPGMSSTATQEERDIVKFLWAREFAAREQTHTGPMSAYALVGDVREGTKRIVFSMFASGDDPSCDAAPNGADANDIYVRCRMRVSSWPPSGAPAAALPGYCMIFAASETNSRIEYRYDSGSQTVQFRTIQFGKVVPNCSRSLKLD
ncbi:hypothetical protein [Comamonas terrigena]|uniref:hypothetical protein n=1 Tax=Comamonas terrigena TaxID=32013 RepID=UPI00244CDE33|nr:hypothetical protein [Comamonas terrigena]MDH1501383.1 hypothetical protein [Comamonas terrigena]